MTANPLVQLAALAEERRLLAENDRRQRENYQERYAPWDPAEMLMRSQRKQLAARLLYECGAFPQPPGRCLEVGYGSLGWLGDLISWGVPETNLSGIELCASRAAAARRVLPLADLRVGSATDLPWQENAFRLVVVSTVFTSILEPRVRTQIAREITRVLEPGGALLWYDFAVNNPRNPHVRKVSRAELKTLFPGLSGQVLSVTLAPPLARLVAPYSWCLATVLQSCPLLRTHLLAVLVKRDRVTTEILDLA